MLLAGLNMNQHAQLEHTIVVITYPGSHVMLQTGTEGAPLPTGC
jgi:hypothetical protein